jgi:ribosomal protein S6--L-glutamate ligase
MVMDVVVLAKDERTDSTQKLMEAFRARNITARLIRPSQCQVDANLGVRYRGQWLERPDVVITRFIQLSSEGTFNRLLQSAIALQWKLEGALCLNPPLESNIAANKFWTQQILQAHDVPTPRTIFGYRFASNPLADQPLVLKPYYGMKGIGVTLEKTWRGALQRIHQRHESKRPLLVQKFLHGRQLRAVVIGDRVVEALERIPKPGEFRANLYLGSRAYAIDLPASYEQIAVRATQALGLHYAGIDMIETDSGVYVLDVNPSPGLKPETEKGPDLAGCVADFLMEKFQVIA